MSPQVSSQATHMSDDEREYFVKVVEAHNNCVPLRQQVAQIQQHVTRCENALASHVEHLNAKYGLGPDDEFGLDGSIIRK